MAGIELRQVCKRYADGAEAVQDLNLEISDGEFVILVGPSGCGKSTTLRMIAGLETVSGGELLIDGEVVNDSAAKDRDIAMVFQNYALYPHMSVRDNMGFALKMRRIDSAEISARVEEAARILDLQPHLDRKPGKLSGGQRQRVAMGRAIVREPKAFLMDEPLSNLDAKLRVEMRAAVSRLQGRLRTTTVYVTHDQTEAMTLGDRVAVMRDGVLQQFAAPRDLYNSPHNLFVAGFIGSPAMNFFGAEVEGSQLNTAIGSIPIPDRLRQSVEARHNGDRRVILGIRPESFEDARFVPPDRDGWTFAAPIELTELMGSEVYAYFGSDVRADVSGGEAAEELRALKKDSGVEERTQEHAGSRAVARVNAATEARAGERLQLWLDTSELYLFDSVKGTTLGAAATAAPGRNGGAA